MSFFKTRITELFGIEYPIIQGGMGAGFISTAELTSAVANAGGIGFMSAIQWRHDFSKLEDEIKKIKDMTDKPWGLNMTLFTEVDPSEFLHIIDLVAKYNIPAIETSARNPEPYIDKLHQAGAKVMHKVARIRDGIKAWKIGADAISIIGSEEGGHPGAERNATSVVGPLMVDSVDVPVVIGGGFCDGRGLVAVLAMGGEALSMGTRFCASEECIIHPNAKQSIVDMKYNETDYILMSIGDPVRCLSTELTQKVLEAEKNNDTQTLFQLLIPMADCEKEGRMPVNTGDMSTGIAPWGMVGGRINSIKPVKQIIDDVVAEAEEVLTKLSARKYWKA
jgi:NAD(P)H-dependent flavin oxidoreductase YrpB (nitropropane dioxygenase family)